MVERRERVVTSTQLPSPHSKACGTASGVTHNYALEEALQASGENRCNEDEADEDSVVGRGPLQESHTL